MHASHQCTAWGRVTYDMNCILLSYPGGLSVYESCKSIPTYIGPLHIAVMQISVHCSTWCSLKVLSPLLYPAVSSSATVRDGEVIGEAVCSRKCRQAVLFRNKEGKVKVHTVYIIIINFSSSIPASCFLVLSHRPSLPPYQLDFGYVVYGQMKTWTVILTNHGYCPASFNTAHKLLNGTGFSVDLVPKVRALPGAPDSESLEFTVQFDPAAIQCPEGSVQALLPFNVRCKTLYYLLKSNQKKADTYSRRLVHCVLWLPNYNLHQSSHFSSQKICLLCQLLKYFGWTRASFIKF